MHATRLKRASSPLAAWRLDLACRHALPPSFSPAAHCPHLASTAFHPLHLLHLLRPLHPKPKPKSTRRRQLDKWRRARQFCVLVAEDPVTGQLLGSATLSMLRPEAALPPPLPSAAPWRAYLSNMAVSRDARRRRVGSALLEAAQQLCEFLY